MPGKYEAPRKRSAYIWLLLAALALLAGGGWLLRSGLPEPGETLPAFSAQTEGILPTAPDKTQPEEPAVTARAVLSAQGDLLMHATFFQEKYRPFCRTGDGEYDFSSLFRYVADYISRADYAAANLETTLGGDDFPYQGNPTFNCPDPILDAVQSAGYDLLLTANNHSYDTLMTGIDRTLEKTRQQGLDTLGTRLSGEESRYQIREINGISIGMVCYTYTLAMDGGRPRLNDNAPVEKPEQINFFSYNNLSGFYEEAEQIMVQMKAEGAEATVLFIHWGTEYELQENATQRKIAQKMCDLGFDLIIGGHPHVVQPMALLESTEDPAHKTVCIYSLGNAVSNQRRERMRLNTGHTEDGLLFTAAFEKNADGQVRLAQAEVLPTWVWLYTNEENRQVYHILPLDPAAKEQWQSLYGLSEETAVELQNSYDRTMAIVGPGLENCRAWLSQ